MHINFFSFASHIYVRLKNVRYIWLFITVPPFGIQIVFFFYFSLSSVL